MEERGAAMVEYGLIAALIALVAAVGAQSIGPALLDFFVSVGGWF